MRDDVLLYYERELNYLRRMGAEFAEKYPKVASRLLLEPGKCEDPHVERLLEGFAFLSARVQLKLDDEFPQVVEGLFEVIYPHFLRPTPSMSVVQFHLDPEQGKLESGLNIPVGSMLYSAPVSGAPCRFRTCYDTTLWPMRITAAEWTTPDRIRPAIQAYSPAAIRLELNCFGDLRLQSLQIDRLRVFLSGEGSITNAVLEILLNNCVGILVRDPKSPEKTFTLPPSVLSHVGLEAEDAMLPFPRRSFWGYRLLTEYFAFPEKLLFFDIGGFDELRRRGFGNQFELIFLIGDFERKDRRQMFEFGVNPELFRLSCTPIVNLFPKSAEPISIEQKKYEYRVVPDARREQYLDVFSVDEVKSVLPGSPEVTTYAPFYSIRHGEAHRAEKAYWTASRRISGWRSDKTSDVFIAFSNMKGERVLPERGCVNLELTCSNRNLPSRLPFGNPDGDFQLEGGRPIKKIVALVKPTDNIEPPARTSLLWRLVSHLSLNYLSLAGDDPDTLREILRLHNIGDSLTGDRQITGITRVSGSPHFTRIAETGAGFARGTRIEIEFDEEQFTGAGVFTLGSVLERFLGFYTSLNSFSQLVVRTRQRKGLLKQWPARSGQKILM